MTKLLLFLLIPFTVVAQSKPYTSRIFKDVYGNWYDTRGIVETEVVQKDTVKVKPVEKTEEQYFGVISFNQNLGEVVGYRAKLTATFYGWVITRRGKAPTYALDFNGKPLPKYLIIQSIEK